MRRNCALNHGQIRASLMRARLMTSYDLAMIQTSYDMGASDSCRRATATPEGDDTERRDMVGRMAAERPGTRLRGPLDRGTAGDREACRRRRRPPGGRGRLSHDATEKRLPHPGVAVRSRKAPPPAHARHLHPIGEQCAPSDLQSAPPQPRCRVANFCLIGG